MPRAEAGRPGNAASVPEHAARGHAEACGGIVWVCRTRAWACRGMWVCRTRVRTHHVGGEAALRAAAAGGVHGDVDREGGDADDQHAEVDGQPVPAGRETEGEEEGWMGGRWASPHRRRGLDTARTRERAWGTGCLGHRPPTGSLGQRMRPSTGAGRQQSSGVCDASVQEGRQSSGVCDASVQGPRGALLPRVTARRSQRVERAEGARGDQPHEAEEPLRREGVRAALAAAAAVLEAL